MSLVDQVWEREILPTLTEYIRIPNLSVAFDPEWSEHGHMAAAVDLVRGWCERRPIAGLTLDVVELPGLTPVIVVDVPACNGGPTDDTVLLYGHLDKQPEMVGWREGLGPWTPVRIGDRLYGRGGADDGYSAFASLTAIQAVQEAGLPHARCVLLVEASEESGSPHLPPYVEHLGDRLGHPGLVVCLDAGAASWDRMWLTTSLRGAAVVVVSVEILTEGVHSGYAGGVVPSSFRILRSLLSRVEDEATGELLLPELQAEVPPDRRAELEAAAAELGHQLVEDLPFVDGAGPPGSDPAQWLEAKTWKASLATTGMDGIPPVAKGGSVLRPSTTAKFTVRLPPTTDARAAADAMVAAFTDDPPYGARVTVKGHEAEGGWNAPPMAPWLFEAATAASMAAFGKAAWPIGEGGSIPFMHTLQERFPEAQLLVTGVLGPGSNAHGPNEFLHLPMVKKLTAAIASVLTSHARRDR